MLVVSNHLMNMFLLGLAMQPLLLVAPFTQMQLIITESLMQQELLQLLAHLKPIF
jgi:hypothetical protein